MSIEQKRLTILIAGASDIGKFRNENQDHFLVGDLRRQLLLRDNDLDGHNEELFGCQDGHLMVVADGMGGMDCGETASRVAVHATAQYVLDMMQWFLKLSPDHEQDFLDELSNSLVAIQNKIWSDKNGECHRMGTTVTMAYLISPKLYVVHAGDSRCYLLRGDTLKQLTTDHTVANQLIAAGTLDANNPNLDRWRHVLWNCVGGEKRVQPEAIRAELRIGDTLLLCSDGLSRMLSDSEIKQHLDSNDTAQGQVDRLISAANHAGGKDNITAIVCQVLPTKNEMANSK